MTPSYTSNEENKKENIEVEVDNVQPSRDEESMDIDGGSVEAEASAPSKYRSFCSGKILVFGVLLAVSFGVISGLAVDNAAKSELIQAQSSTWGKTSKKGGGKGGKKGKKGGKKGGKKCGKKGGSKGGDSKGGHKYKGGCSKKGYSSSKVTSNADVDYAQGLVTVAENITDEAGDDVYR